LAVGPSALEGGEFFNLRGEDDRRALSEAVDLFKLDESQTLSRFARKRVFFLPADPDALPNMVSSFLGVEWVEVRHGDTENTEGARSNSTLRASSESSVPPW
jgi:hypothetical protein